MGEGVRKLGTDAQTAAVAAQASEDIKSKKEKELKAKTPINAGLRLENLPKAADSTIDVKDAEATGAPVEATDATETAENILTEMDKQLDNVQKGLRDFIAKKIKLAAQNSDPVKSKKLLRSAYNDTKKAYDKIKKVREQLS